MKKQLFLWSLLSFCCFGIASAQLQTIFEDDFESYTDFAISNVGNWTLIDVDQLPKLVIQNIYFPNRGVPAAFMVFNSTATDPSLQGAGWVPNTGTKYMAAFASDSPNSNVPSVNDGWLISPRITLLEEENTLRFWAKSVTTNFGADRFRVAISNTDLSLQRFESLTEEYFLETTEDWQEFSFDLDAYAGQEVYIAINCISERTQAFLVNDFLVEGKNNLGINKILANQFKVYPNPTTDRVIFSNSDDIRVSKIEVSDLNGRKVKEMELDSVSESVIDISQLQSGVYFLKFITNEGKFSRKIIKE